MPYIHGPYRLQLVVLTLVQEQRDARCRRRPWLVMRCCYDGMRAIMPMVDKGIARYQVLVVSVQWVG